MPLDFDQPIRLPMVPALEARNISRSTDAMLINCYAEKQPQTGGYKIRKRFGTSTAVIIPPAATGWGQYYWTGETFSAAGTKIYRDVTQIYTGTNAAPMYFTELAYLTNNSRYLLMQDGFNGYYVEFLGYGFVPQQEPSFFAVQVIASAGFPTGLGLLAGGIVTLNSRAYVMEFSGKIHGSDVDTPGTWNALNLIVANEEPDMGVMLSKHYNYIVALKARTVQFFYDAGNPTGSVLSPVQGATQRFGCMSAESVQDIDSTLLWVSSNDTESSVKVVRMDKMQITVISTPMIERIISVAALDFSANVVPPFRLPNDTIRSAQIKHAGHRFYVISFLPSVSGTTYTLPAPYAAYSAQFSLVYDLDEDLWYFWGSGLNTGKLDAVSSFPYLSSPVGPKRWQDFNTGKIYPFDTDDVFPTDQGVTPRVDIITPNFDADTGNTKTLSRLSFLTDKVAGSTLQVRYNDDDYDISKWSNWRAVNLALPDPFLTKEGSFLRRAYQFRHESPTALNLRAVDMHLSEGSKRG